MAFMLQKKKSVNLINLISGFCVYIHFSEKGSGGFTRLPDRSVAQKMFLLVGAKISAPVQAGPGNHPASFTMGTDRFRGGEVAGTWR
jgi:hypothetical protein